MPTNLGRSYPLTWRGNPPYMLDTDVPVWYRFLEKYGAPFINLYYEVRVGGPFLTPLEAKDPLKKDWQMLLQKRLDALAELKDEVWIIEVNAEANLRSLGQVITYQTLWLRDPKIPKIERLILVGQNIDPDLIDAAGQHGVQVYVV